MVGERRAHLRGRGGGKTTQYGTAIRNGGERTVELTGVGPRAVAPEFQLSVADVRLGGELGAPVRSSSVC